MFQYILKRIFLMIPVLLGISIITFILMQVVPGDPVSMMFDKRGDIETINRIRDELGLNDPIPVQYGRFLWKALRGDLGISFKYREPVTKLLLDRFPVTMKVALSSLALALVIGLLVGIVSAVKQYSIFDHAMMVLALLGISAPIFWVAILLQIQFGLRWKLFPISGYRGVEYMVLPAIALGTRYAASIARMTRTSMLEVIRQDYIRTAWAKGLSQKVIIFKHALKNALIPVVTMVGMMLGGLLTGSILTETIFGIPGLGLLSMTAITARDFTLLEGTTLFTATVYVVTNLLVDLSYAYIDPRIRYGGD